MITVKGPMFYVDPGNLGGVDMNMLGCGHVPFIECVPEVQIDYDHDAVRNIIDHNDGTCTCDIESPDENAIIADVKYQIV